MITLSSFLPLLLFHSHFFFSHRDIHGSEQLQSSSEDKRSGGGGSPGQSYSAMSVRSFDNSKAMERLGDLCNLSIEIHSLKGMSH